MNAQTRNTFAEWLCGGPVANVSRALAGRDVCHFRRIAFPLETLSIASPILSHLANLDERYAINSKLRQLRRGGATFGDMLA